MEKKVTLNPDGDTFFSDDDMPGQKIIYGVGARNRVGEVAKELGRNILLVTDSGLSSVGHPQNLKEILSKEKDSIIIFVARLPAHLTNLEFSQNINDKKSL